MPIHFKSLRVPRGVFLWKLKSPVTGFLFFMLLASGTAEAQPPDKPVEAVLDDATEQKARVDIDSYLKLAKSAVEKDNLPLAERFYQRMITIPSSNADKREGLLEMAQSYESRKAFSKAIAVYETFNHVFPGDPQLPDILIKLGRLYRDAGTYQLALDRFYNVLHSVLGIREGELSTYQSATLLAQFEIAETYFQIGDYKQAAKFFNLIKLLDLTPENKEHAFFRSLHCQFLLDDYQGAIGQGKAFIRDFPDSSNVPQARYIMASAYKASNHPREALTEVLELLRTSKANAKKDPEAWTYWKKMTGNQIANQFYLDADFLSALQIYQSLAKLSDAPDWQWPVIYQMGICFERLRLPARASEAYRYIVDEFGKLKEPEAIAPSLAALKDMAQWHVDHVAWQQNTESQLQALLPAPELSATSEPLAAQQALRPPVSLQPSELPQPSPSAQPSASPQPSPSAQPSASPQPSPSVRPSASPQPSPSAQPSASPQPSPSVRPASTPRPSPSARPSASPQSSPTARPSAVPRRPSTSGSAPALIAPTLTQ